MNRSIRLGLLSILAMAMTGCPSAPESKAKPGGETKGAAGISGGMKVAFVSNNAAEF